MKTSRKTLSTSGISTVGIAALLIIGLIGSVVLVGVATNQISLTGPSGQPPCGAGTQWNGSECVAITTPPPPVTGLGNPTSALYKVGVTDLYGSALIANTGVDVIYQSNLDTRHDNVLPTHTSEAGAQALAAGDNLYFHVYSTNGNGYYDRWFRVNNLQVEAPVELMTPVWHDAQPIGSWGYSYTIIGSGVEYLAGATPYWIFPTFPIIQRSTAANVDYAAQWAGATTVSATGASSTTYSSGAAKYTATGPTFKMKFEISTAAVSTSIGQPMLVLTSTLPRQFRALFFVLWFSLNNTQCLDSDGPFVNGFHKVPFSSTVYSVYYKIIDAVTSTQNSGGNRAEEISMDTAPVGGSVGISVRFWCTDLQSPPDVSGGASDAYPLPYGGMTAIGTGTSLIDANGFQYASGVPTAECCYTIITTHA